MVPRRHALFSRADQLKTELRPCCRKIGRVKAREGFPGADPLCLLCFGGCRFLDSLCVRPCAGSLRILRGCG